jgi:hypothetical protein
MTGQLHHDPGLDSPTPCKSRDLTSVQAANLPMGVTMSRNAEQT